MCLDEPAGSKAGRYSEDEGYSLAVYFQVDELQADCLAARAGFPAAPVEIPALSPGDKSVLEAGSSVGDIPNCHRSQAGGCNRRDAGDTSYAAVDNRLPIRPRVRGCNKSVVHPNSNPIRPIPRAGLPEER